MSIFTDLARLCQLENDEDIADSYKTDEEMRSIYIAKIYCKYSNYLRWYDKKTYYTDDDKESILLEVIQSVLEDYDRTKGGSFRTVLATYLKNRFRYEDEYTFAKSRSWYINTTFASGSVDTEDGNGMELLDLLAGGTEDRHDFEILDTIETLPLSENQYRYCQFVLSLNYVPTDTEAAEALGISKSGVGVIKSYLRDKLKDVLF